MVNDSVTALMSIDVWIGDNVIIKDEISVEACY